MVSFDYGQEAGCVLLGSMKMQINADISFNYKEYSYNNKYVYQYDVVYKDHLITNFGDINLLIYCLSETFLKDIRRESDATKNMSDNQLVEHIFKEYGTHAILGITTGGSFFAEYTISTNKKEIAAGVKAGFGVSSGGQAIDQIVASNFNLSIDIQEEIEKNTETTKTDFRTHYYGGKGGAATSPISVDSALSKWSDSMNEDVATSIKFTKDGAISIVSLLRSIDYSLANKLDAYITEKADETYKTLFNQFSKPATLPVDMQTENGDNMLVIDLSSFQQVGNLDNVYYPTVEDNVFIIYPTMFAKTVECIKIVGAYNTCNNMISSFSIRLSDEWISNTNSNWDKNIDIILENVGFYTANENGFIDITEIENKAKVNIICIGNNAISAHDGNGQSAIILEELTITSLGESASLTVTGGKGADGDDGEKVGDGQHGNRGKDGLHGGTAIEANSLSVNNINLHLTG
ncbi:MAG: hypothetical protein IJB13_03605, partial [Clostridia bacterium]|nr:hypothetical protein [Clostridia bacterium]